MIVIGIFVGFFMVVAAFSTVNALGMWLFLLIAHGVLVQTFGDVAVHLPLYTGLAVTLVVIARRQWSGVRAGDLLLFIITAVIMGVAASLGMDKEISIVAMVSYGKGFLLALLLAGCIKSESDFKVMTFYCLAGLFVGVLVTIYQYETGTFTLSDIYMQRAAGLRADPNDTAMLLVAGVPLSIYWYMSTSRLFLKMFFLSSLFMLLVGIGLTLSRSGFVALAMILLLIYLRRPSVQLIVVGVLILAVALTLAPKSYWEHMQTLTTGKEEHGGRSLSSRLLVLEKGVDIFMRHPALGVGPGNFGNAFEAETKPEVQIATGSAAPKVAVHADRGIVAHNMYLEFFAENGLIGGSLFLFILYRSLRNLIVYDRYYVGKSHSFGLGYALSLALAGLLFAGLFLSQGRNSVLWFLVGLALAAGQMKSKDNQAKTSVNYMPKTIFSDKLNNE